MMQTQSAISAKKVCPSPSFNDVDGDKKVKANMDGDDTPSQSDQNDQGEEEEEIKEDEDFTFGKPALKKKKSPLSPIKMIREKRRRKLEKIRILLLKPASRKLKPLPVQFQYCEAWHYPGSLV